MDMTTGKNYGRWPDPEPAGDLPDDEGMPF